MGNINKWLIIGFSAIWTILVILSYWGFHPYYGVVISDLPNVGILITLGVLSTGAWWLLKSRTKPLRGWMIYAFVLFLEVIIFLIYSSREKVFSDSPAAHLPYFLGFNLVLQGAVAYLFLVQVAIGDCLFRFIPLRITKENTLVIQLATGLSVSGFVLVILGMVGGLNTWVLWGLSIIPVLFSLKTLRQTLIQLFWTPLKKGVTTGWGIIPILMMLIAIAFNQITAIKAFPTGFDAVSLYMNRSHLIAHYGSLVAGGQADGWPLFTSLGELMFGSVSISIMISHSAMLLCVLAFYRLSRLFLSKQTSWLAVALFYINPAFSFHAAHDAKVDLAFLFVLLSALLLLLDVRQHSTSKPNPDQSQSFGQKEELVAWILAGWLAGYAFGIKYTAIMFMIATMTMLFSWLWGWRGAAGVFLTALGSLFLVGIDQFGYLELGDSSPVTFALIGIGLGLPLIVWGGINRKVSLSKALLVIGGFGLAALLSFSPWMVKNIMEHDSLSMKNLLVGQSEAMLIRPKVSERKTQLDSEFAKRMILTSLSNLGVELTPQQVQFAESFLPKLADVGSDSLSGADQLENARIAIVQNVLTPEQKNLVLSSLNQSKEVEASLTEQLDLGKELIINNLKRRGITLDEQQKLAVINLLRFQNVMVEDRTERKARLSSLKNDIFNTVLTAEQYEMASGRNRETGQESTLRSSALEIYHGGAKREEIRRYLGFEPGAPLYLSMPYDLTMTTNILFSRYLDISFLFLLILPFLFFGRSWYRNVIIAIGFLILWLISVLSLYPADVRMDSSGLTAMIKGQMGEPLSGLGAIPGMLFLPMQTMLVKLGNNFSQLYEGLAGLPFIATFIIMLILFGLAAYFIREKIVQLPDPLRHLTVFAAGFGGLWFFFSNAIVWYGFIMFMVGFLILAWLTDHLKDWYPEIPAKLLTKGWQIAIGSSLVLCLSLYLVSATQSQAGARFIFQSNFLEYAGSNITAEQSLSQFRPYLLDAIQKLNEDPSANIYRIGTHMNYHLLENDKRVLEDNQLGIYMSMSRSMQDKNDFIRTLIDNEFQYVLYGLNVGSMDKTPEQSLVKKADEMLNLLFDSPLATPIYTDNFIKDAAIPSTKVGNKVWPGKPGLGGETTVPGTFILFQLARKVEN